MIPKVYAPFYYQILKLRESGCKGTLCSRNHDYWVMDFIMIILFDEVYEEDLKVENFKQNILYNPW